MGLCHSSQQQSVCPVTKDRAEALGKTRIQGHVPDEGPGQGCVSPTGKKSIVHSLSGASAGREGATRASTAVGEAMADQLAKHSVLRSPRRPRGQGRRGSDMNAAPSTCPRGLS